MVDDDCVDPVKEATMRCNCDAAQYYRHLEDCRMKAKANIALIMDEQDTLQRFLLAAVDIIGEHFKDLSVKDNSGARYSLKIKTDGTIKVTRTITQTDSLE